LVVFEPEVDNKRQKRITVRAHYSFFVMLASVCFLTNFFC